MNAMEGLGDDGRFMTIEYRKEILHDTPLLSKRYVEFVDFFVAYAFGREDVVLCPCKQCNNRERMDVRDDVRLHLVRYGFDVTYDVWMFHGEVRSGESCGIGKSKMEVLFDNIVTDFEHEPKILASLLGEKDRELYPGCKDGDTVLSCLMEVFNMKAASSWSDVSVNALLKFLHKILPEGNGVPKSLYDAKKILCPFELEYEKIHACPNDCILYRGNKLKDEVQCPVCKTSRYEKKKISKGGEEMVGSIKDKVPAKCVWYLPIIPRLERLFGNVEDAKNLTWHFDRERPDDNVIRHPSDSDQWKKN